MIDYSKLTWMQMAKIVDSIAREAQRRNPIGINMYTPAIRHAALKLAEIANGEAYNFSSESGPKEPKPRKRKVAA